MDKEQEKEWLKAQSITLSANLINTAKNLLQFLATVDRNRYLYEGSTLEWAIYRYNAFWLPLLAKHLEKPVIEEPLMVPLDCEWIWHCHRLNPVRYKLDCEKLFGRTLDTHNTISSVQESLKDKSEKIWREMYPEEPFEFDFKKHSNVGDVSVQKFQSEKFTTYDLVSAVQRQVSFTHQVSQAHWSDDQFLDDALTRYKGFLYLIKTTKKKVVRLDHGFVPTYDIDLMWHSHQLHPVSYCDDMRKLLGKMMNHDDTDTDRSKGSKLQVGFAETMNKWEDTFGLRYSKAGANYKRLIPTPVTQIPFRITTEEANNFHAQHNYHNFIHLSHINFVEVLFEFVKIKNIPEEQKYDFRVLLSRKLPHNNFIVKRMLTISSESKEKQVANFLCRPSEEFLFQLVYRPSSVQEPNFEYFGSCSLSLQECMSFGSELFVDKWLKVVPTSEILNSKPIFLHVSLSYTPPTPASRVFHLNRSSPTFNASCHFLIGNERNIMHFIDHTYFTCNDGNDVLTLQMREMRTPELLKEVQYVTVSGDTHTLAEFKENEWCIKGVNGSTKLCKTSENKDHLLELVGPKMVRVYAGKKMDYEEKNYENKISDQDCMTIVEFSIENPYGKAIAMIDFKHGILKVKDEHMVLTSITLAFILFDILKREGDFVEYDIST